MMPLLIALQFLTRLPVSLPGMPTPEQMGRSLLWYPTIGLLLGLLLWLAHLLLGQTPAVLQAAIILAMWVGLSGALHLDGLADTADAWVGGFGDRERTLAIMKDPRSGPIAVVVLMLLLLLKLVALFTLLQAYEYMHAGFSFGGHLYGSTFFMATGFHGFHVLVGTIFLAVCLFRALSGHFSPKQHFGFEAAAWYWHFVDVVWLFLFACIYIWGAGANAGAGH